MTEEQPNPMQEQAEMTFCLIKPYAVNVGLVDEIRTFIERNRFFTVAQKRLIITPVVIKSLYRDETTLPKKMAAAVTGPAVYLQLSRENAIETLRKLAGHDDPTKAGIGTLHYMFGASVYHNGVLVPRNEAEFTEMFGKLEFWFKIYVQALTRAEEDPIAWAEQTYAIYMRQSVAEVGTEGGSESPDAEAPAASEEEDANRAVEKVADSYSPRSDADSAVHTESGPG